jgi:phosphoglycolate phosphatase
MRYQYILFDLDGTLIDSKEGITKSVQYALESLGISEDNPDNLLRFIGPPLMDSFQDYYDMDEETSKKGLIKYRERFETKGMYENKVYPGISDMLDTLISNNLIPILATSKPEIYAEKILVDLNLAKYFKVIVGSEMDGSRAKKKDIILEVFQRMNFSSEDLRRVVMVGDREHDIIGANACHIDSIGVRYGFAKEDELEKVGATYIINSTQELAQFLTT